MGQEQHWPRKELADSTYRRQKGQNQKRTDPEKVGFEIKALKRRFAGYWKRTFKLLEHWSLKRIRYMVATHGWELLEHRAQHG